MYYQAFQNRCWAESRSITMIFTDEGVTSDDLKSHLSARLGSIHQWSPLLQMQWESLSIPTSGRGMWACRSWSDFSMVTWCSTPKRRSKWRAGLNPHVRFLAENGATKKDSLDLSLAKWHAHINCLSELSSVHVWDAQPWYQGFSLISGVDISESLFSLRQSESERALFRIFEKALQIYIF
jgi:hypothetical protein